MKNYKHILSALTESLWLLKEESLRAMIDIVKKHNDIESLRSIKPDVKVSNVGSVHGNVYVLNLMGPVFPYANLMTEMCGATSLEQISKEFKSAEENPDIDTIVSYIDSPGGHVTGTSEYAKMVADSNKKTVAYVSGTAASAAYWIASAHDEIIINDTARLGSIGVVVAIPKNDPDIIEIVSSNSPHKRPDPETDKGRDVILKELDALAEVFISTVAKNRNVSEEFVIDSFGKGGVLVGQAAIDIGMADRVGSFDQLILGLTKRFDDDSTYMNHDNNGDMSMDFKEFKSEYPDLYAKAVSEGKAEAKVEAKAEAETEAKKREDALATSYQKKLSEMSEKIEALEKKEAIRETEHKAGTAWLVVDKVMAASGIPDGLNDKVKKSFSGTVKKYVAGNLNDEEFNNALAADISEWSSVLESYSVGGLAGVGANVRGNEGSSISDEVVDRMFSHLNVGGE